MVVMNGPYDTGRFADAGDLSTLDSNTDVAVVIGRMLSDLTAHPGEWENGTLERFLEALAGAWHDLAGLYRNRGEEFPAAAGMPRCCTSTD